MPAHPLPHAHLEAVLLERLPPHVLAERLISQSYLAFCQRGGLHHELVLAVDKVWVLFLSLHDNLQV